MSLPQSSESIRSLLLEWKFPERNVLIRLIARKNLINIPPGLPRAVKGDRDIEVKYNEMIAYQRLLETKSNEELAGLFEEEKIKQSEKLRLEAEKREEEAVFNQSYAMADANVYEHYAKMEYWTMDEAIILSFGRNPEVVNSVTIANSGLLKPSTPTSTFIVQYTNLQDLTKRAVSFKKLYDPVIPSLFLQWAKKKDICIPQPLIDMVDKYGTNYIDWQEHYNQLKGQHDKLLNEWNKLVKDFEWLRNDRDNFKAKVAELDANQPKDGQEPDKPRYSTPLIAIMDKAIAEFFDPRRNPDAKKDEVVPWIKEQMTAEKMRDSNNMATAIFTIIMPPDHDPKKRRG